MIGLAHARAAAASGKSVVVFERHPFAQGASIRNFGMIWPIGQPAGRPLELARLSRARWIEAAQTAGFWLNSCGSIHLAHREDEFQVLEEFAESAPNRGYNCRLQTAAEVLAKTPAANPAGLIGGLWSETELAVDPREVIRTVPRWLKSEFGVRFEFARPVSHVESGELVTADGRVWRADRILIASGSDLKTLFPEVLASAGLVTSKLQMLRTVPQPAGFKLGPHLAGGLTLRHYQTFADCPALKSLKDRIARETPALDRYGIHVMAAQNQRGEITLGDSHEYGEDLDPFYRQEIEELILEELRKMIRLEDWTIRERWYGIYAKSPEGLYFEHDPLPGVKIVTGLGGAGMTLSWGVADDVWSRWTA